MISFVKRMWQKYATGDLATERSESFASSDSSRSSNLSDAPENEESKKNKEKIEEYIATLLTIYEDKDPIRSSNREDKIIEAKNNLKLGLGLNNVGDKAERVNEIINKLEEKVKRKMSFIPSMPKLRRKNSQTVVREDPNTPLGLLESTSFKIDRRVFAPQPKYKTMDSIKERVEDNKNRIHLNTKTSGRAK
ncbi:MAG: hypothetical protein WBJ81_03095 [Rickettsiales bacterium]